MRTDPQMKIRLPAAIKEWLEMEAARNLRSMTAEIVLSVRERMERAQAATGESLQANAPAAVTNSPALQSGAITHG